MDGDKPGAPRNGRPGPDDDNVKLSRGRTPQERTTEDIMTQTNVNPNMNQNMKRHRRAAQGGGLVGLALLACYFGYDLAMTPATPDMATAKASEIVAFVGSERGLGRLSQIEQEQFLERWRLHVQEPGRDKELKECLENLDDGERKSFAEAVIRQSKRAFIDDAKQFAQLRTPEEKNKFVREKLDQYAAAAQFTRNIAASFRDGAPRSQDEFQRWLLENTTAEERAIGEPYVEALKRVREIVKKEQRGAEAKSVSAAGTGA